MENTANNEKGKENETQIQSYDLQAEVAKAQVEIAKI